MTLISPAAPNSRAVSFGKAFFLAGLVAGTLDILSATALYTAITGTFRPMRLFQGIAYGAFGKSALEGGTGMAILGLLFHYLIAFTWVLIYFLLYPSIPFMRRHKVLSGLLYGIIVWVIMNRVVIPLSQITPGPFRWDRALMNMAILMVMIGLPASLFANWYYKNAAVRNRDK